MSGSSKQYIAYKMGSISPILTELITMGSSVNMIVTGDSMYPFLRNLKDSVTLRYPKKRLKVCDIVLVYRPDGSYVLHRVVKIEGGRFCMLGDAQTKTEGPLPLDCIIAAVSAVNRNDREISTDSIIWRGLSIIWLLLKPLRILFIRKIQKISRFWRQCYESLNYEGL